MSATIVQLSDYRLVEAEDDEIDLVTAVDVVIRDLREILSDWNSNAARLRIEECERMLRTAYVEQTVHD